MVIKRKKSVEVFCTITLFFRFFFYVKMMGLFWYFNKNI